MFQRLVLPLLIILFTSSQVSSLELNCNYKFHTNWWAVDNIYFCEQTTSLVTTPNDIVDKIHGEHKENYGNNDVKGFRVDDKTMNYFPKGIDKFFPNLQFIAIWTTELKEIRQSDLAPFTKLRILSIWNNQIEVLEKDLLQFNTEIEYIGFGKNNIKFVDGKIFNHLRKLHTFHFDGNDCVSRQVAGNKHEVWDLTEEIEERCSDCRRVNDPRYHCDDSINETEVRVAVDAAKNE
ncbi:hypothetical protein PVAND_017275 [Polypedilum vanderplanki]|uniref:Uncharacterized protein n=1 Tax=Polypedilum vanderplanki TaxID=319348 RepID=A0A9J6BHT0_POLVA|nr:hypothetical protein PVAND_017275 [Polypedilum vanderplanki]